MGIVVVGVGLRMVVVLIMVVDATLGVAVLQGEDIAREVDLPIVDVHLDLHIGVECLHLHIIVVETLAHDLVKNLRFHEECSTFPVNG